MEGKLVLTTLDAGKDGFTIEFDPRTLNNEQLKGVVTSKGRGVVVTSF